MLSSQLVENAVDRGAIDEGSALSLTDMFQRGDIYRNFHEPIDFVAKVVKAHDDEGLAPDAMIEQDARTIIRAAGEYFVRFCAV
jgi:hypothetical protein